jgi:hypothetical protein
MKSRSIRAFTGGEILLVLVVVGALGWGVTKVVPAFNGESRRAKEGQETTTALVQASDSIGAAQTASATVIGEAVADMPPSPNRSFVLNEVPIMLARGPSPDAKQLLAARDRRIAYLEGRLDEQAKLTKNALKEAGQLRADNARALAAKKASDDAITIAAAENVAANRTKLLFAALAAAALGLWLYTKFTTLPKIDLARIANRARDTGGNILEALDAVVPDSWHEGIAAQASKLRAKEAARKAASEAAAKS